MCSCTAVYEPNGHHPFVETDPLGDNHRPFGYMPTYSISKIAAEVVARLAARQHGLPTTIARLSVPYGDRFGWPLFHLAMMAEGQPVPVHVDAPSVYTRSTSTTSCARSRSAGGGHRARHHRELGR